MHTIQLVLIVISGLFITHARPVEEDVERQQRVLLHSDGDLMDVLAKTQAMVATLNSTLNNLLVTTKAEIGTMNSTIHLQNGRILQLEAALQTEIGTRCQAGTATFPHEECAKGHCSENVVINFNPHFTKTPILMYGFSELDVQEDRNMRVAVSTVQVATNAATLKVATWADTIIHGSWVRWMACPQ